MMWLVQAAGWGMPSKVSSAPCSRSTDMGCWSFLLPCYPWWGPPDIFTCI